MLKGTVLRFQVKHKTEVLPSMEVVGNKRPIGQMQFTGDIPWKASRPFIYLGGQALTLANCIWAMGLAYYPHLIYGILLNNK